MRTFEVIKETRTTGREHSDVLAVLCQVFDNGLVIEAGLRSTGHSGGGSSESGEDDGEESECLHD